MKKVIVLFLLLSLNALSMTEIDKKFYKIVYDENVRGATFVYYTLESKNVNKSIKKRPSFYTEKSLDESYQTKSSDYKNSGYDRGHLANDASFDWCEESLMSTYSMANIVPQLPKVNRQIWSKLERLERNLTTQFGEITVINLVEYKEDKKINKIKIPSGFYKILINNSKGLLSIYYVANKNNSVVKKLK